MKDTMPEGDFRHGIDTMSLIGDINRQTFSCDIFYSGCCSIPVQ